MLRALERFPVSARYTIEIPGIIHRFYIGYYFGHDYCNIWFDRLINVFQIGIVGDVAPVLFDKQTRARGTDQVNP